MLELDAASKRFGSLPALDACSFTARPGRLTGFLGPNGAGKTTAMRTVFGLVELDSGAVRWQGAPIGPEQRAQFGYMPEERVGRATKRRRRSHLATRQKTASRQAPPNPQRSSECTDSANRSSRASTERCPRVRGETSACG